MLPKPSFFDFWRAPRRVMHGAAILVSSIWFPNRLTVNHSYKTNRAWIMSNTTFMGLSGSGSLILILFKRFEVKVTSQCLHKCHFPCQIARTGPHRAFVPFLEAQLKNDTQRIDAIWNNYPEENNIKALTEKRHGNGRRTRIGNGSTKIPKHEWNGASLKMRRTKSNCFHSSAHRYPRIIWVENSSWVPDLRPCSQTDHVMSQRLSHATIQRQILGFFCTWHMPPCKSICPHSGQWCRGVGCQVFWVSWLIRALGGLWYIQKYRDIPIHTIRSNIGPLKSLALPLFHSLTGCDTTSQFLGCGKKTAWAAWSSMPELTDTLLALTYNPDLFCLNSVYVQRIESFVVLMYSRGCGADRGNEALHCLFTTGSRPLENMSPTEDALFQHVKRALLQASFYWSQATSILQEIPNISEWGWHKDINNTWQPLWTTLSDASVTCVILLHCGRCKCKRAVVKCTALCKCESGCINK